MKKLVLILAVLKLTNSQAQFSVGSQGITIKAGTGITFENLSLLPSSDLTITDNTLQKSETALPGSPHGSINRVYRFGSVINFSGTAAISYLTSELNGNVENDLQILYSPDENQGFTVTTGSTVDLAVHRVSNVLSNTNLVLLSASGPTKPLPVTLVSFSVLPEGRAALLKWTTSEEINADRFEIERSPDAKNWILAGWKSAVAAPGTLQDYIYTDADVADGINYYRLKMIDRDRSYAYSQIRSVLFSLPEEVVVFPNPVTDKLYLKNLPANNAVTISVYGISGRLHFEEAMSPGESLNIKDLAPGTYVLKMTQGSGRQSTHTFVKQ